MWFKFWKPNGPISEPEPARKDIGNLYFSRTSYETSVSAALEGHENLVLYGPARQGKTTLLGRLLPIRSSIYIECRADFKRTHIYRLILSQIGYSISVEKKRKMKAKYSVKFNILAQKMQADIDGENERTFQEINIDLKNASEVAHLLSRISDTPYVILNGFERLRDYIKDSLIQDIIFFTEVSNIKFIIIGSWNSPDYLETINPAISGKFTYVNVPYWSESELRAVHNFWRTERAISIATPDKLDEMVSLSGGDIALFVALHSIPLTETSSAFKQHAEEIVVGRTLRWLGVRISEILAQRDLSFSYLAVSPVWEMQQNPKFKPIRGYSDQDYPHILEDPQTGRPYHNGRAVAVDRAGNPRYIEKILTRTMTMNGNVGKLLFRELHRSVQAGKNSVSVDHLINTLKLEIDKEGLNKALPVDDSKIEWVILNIDEAQRRSNINPKLVGLSSDAPQVITVLDRRFYLALSSMGLEEFDDWLVEYTPGIPKPKRIAHLSSNLSSTEMDRIASEVISAAVGESDLANKSVAEDEDEGGHGDEENDEENEVTEDDQEANDSDQDQDT